jgi:hypothetical protein
MSKRWLIFSLIALLSIAAPSSADSYRVGAGSSASSSPSFQMVSAVQTGDPALRLGYRLGGRVDQELPTTEQRQFRIFLNEESRESKKERRVFVSPDVGSLRSPEFTMSVGITW